MAGNLNMMQRRHLISYLFIDFLHTVVVVAAAGPRHAAGADLLVPPYRQQDLQVRAGHCYKSSLRMLEEGNDINQSFKKGAGSKEKPNQIF